MYRSTPHLDIRLTYLPFTVSVRAFARLLTGGDRLRRLEPYIRAVSKLVLTSLKQNHLYVQRIAYQVLTLTRLDSHSLERKFLLLANATSAHLMSDTVSLVK